MSIFSDRLISLRKALNLTQKDIADRFLITRSAYSAWELARNEPPLSFVRDFCATFDISSDYLLGLSDICHPTASINLPPQIIQRSPLDDLSPERQKAVEDFIEFQRAQQRAECSPSQQEA